MSSAPLHLIKRHDGQSNGLYIVTFKDNACKEVFCNRDIVRPMVACNWSHAVSGCAGIFDTATLETLSRSTDVMSIEQDAVVKHCTKSENEPFLKIDTQPNAPWGLQRISQRDKVPNQGEEKLVYNYRSKGKNLAGASVDIYVVDTGIRTTHVDFGGRARWGKTFGPYGDSDGNGHGTHCAGTAGGTQYGVAKDAGLVAVKVLGDNGQGFTSDIISGLDWVVQDAQSTGKASVVSMSLGEPSSQALDDAVNNLANKYGIHVVVAAGNDNKDAEYYSPAGAAEAITVAASNISDKKRSTSNYGSVVDLFAPGENVVSAWISDDTASKSQSGTSMATPHVAGLVAYWINAYNNLPPRDMKAVLRGVATKDALSDIPSGTDNLLVFNVSTLYK